MFKRPIAAACSSIVVALVGALGLAAETNAARYTGTFDPETTQYKWSGTHEFDVGNACLSSNGWKAANDPYTNDCAVALTGGSLTVLDKIANVQETIDFSGITPNFNIWGIYVEGNELAGVDSDLIGQLFFDTDPLDDFEWWLRWESGKAPTADYQANEDGGFYGYSYTQNLIDPVYLSRCTDDECIQPTGPADIVTFTRVPEPGSLGLVGAALAGVWLARRRRPGR